MRITRLLFSFLLLLLFSLAAAIGAYGQGKLYTARGYWEESTKSNYQELKLKVGKGDSLTSNEKNYLQDYEAYLSTYYQRLSEENKQDYQRLKPMWDRELSSIGQVDERKDYDLRGRDRVANGLYGLYYGASLSAITGADGGAAGGITLITSGLWMLGPAINPKKYEGITRNTIRAGNTGKILGLINGAALGLLIGGESDDVGKVMLGLSTAGSIILGEVAFQGQKTNNYPAGRIEMIRHFGFLGPWLGISTLVATGNENANAAGAALLAGGLAGFALGNRAAGKYAYTKGDVDAVSSLTLITTGIGFTLVTESMKNNDATGLWLVPAISSVVGTLWGQQSVRGAHLTDKQGSTIRLSTAGAALMGLGIVELANSPGANISSAIWLGVPSGLALITQQGLLHNYKMKNLEMNLRGSSRSKHNYKVGLQITPESYFVNQRISPRHFTPETYTRIQNPLFRLSLTF